MLAFMSAGVVRIITTCYQNLAASNKAILSHNIKFIFFLGQDTIFIRIIKRQFLCKKLKDPF